MTALRAVIANLQHCKVAECALDVEHVLHAVGGRKMLVGAPGKTNWDRDRQRRSVDEIRVTESWLPVGGRRHLPRTASQSAIEIEDGVLTFLRVEKAESGADRPFTRGAPGDPQPG